MVCSSCGYDNPREHRYCGMCGTPFPHRALTVPEAQSTLSFSSAPLEIAPSLRLPVVEPAEPETLEPQRPAIAQAQAVDATPASVADAQLPEPAPAPIEMAAAEPREPVAAVPPEIEPLEATPPEIAETAAEPPRPRLEAAALVDQVAPEEPLPAPITEPVTAGPEPVVPQTAGKAAPLPPPEAPTPVPPAPPTRRVLVMPAPHPHPAPAASAQAVPPRPVPVHPSPDSLKITSPPASAGMPTYQEVVDASGAPPSSPFEAPDEAHPDQDRELQEYVASFRYTPPAETADELTMRSEVPVIDKEAPAEFHHPSFDDDVPPPPEAGPHPTGEEYYRPAATTEHSRLLDLAETWHADSGGNNSFPPIPSGDEPAPEGSKWWLWSSIAALVVIFGGLGFWEGRAQSTHAFRGPVAVVRDAYDGLRQQLAQDNAGAGSPPSSPAAAVAQPPAPTPKSAIESKSAPASAQSETSSQPNPPAAAPGTQPAQSQPVPADTAKRSVSDTQQTPAPEVANTTRYRPIEAPPPKPSSKPQPGQQELNKARDASDPTAAAAWLWKATSRGNPEAPVRLADLYIKGNGVPKSCEQALVLLRSAATKENAPARNRLAALYANGTCVTRDRVKAYQLMSSALLVDPSSDWARENREEIWNQMTPQERAEAQKYR